MDFRLSDEQLAFRAHCHRFAEEVIRPLADKYDREQAVPYEAVKAAREWDLHGMQHIMAMGSDPDGMLGVIYAEELHWGCAGIALAISASSSSEGGPCWGGRLGSSPQPPAAATARPASVAAIHRFARTGSETSRAHAATRRAQQSAEIG